MSVNTLKTVNAFQIFKLAIGSVLAAVMVLAFVGGSSFAQTDTGTKDDTAAANVLKVSPLRTDVATDPGTSTTVKVTVTNPTDQKVGVRVIQNDFVAGDEDGTPAIILDETETAPTHSLKRFMIPIESITLEPKEARVVEVELVIPADAEPGGYFGVVRFAPTDPDTGGQVNTSASVASLILLTVNGDAPEKLDVTQYEVQQNGRRKTFLINGDGLKLVTRFENKGDVQAGPFGKISVLKGDEVVYDYDFNNDEPREVVLPDSARRWEVPLENTTSFGRYTVMATYTYGSTNQTIEMTETFWVVPRNTIIAAVIGLIVLAGIIAGGIFYLRRRRNGSMSKTFEAKRRR